MLLDWSAAPISSASSSMSRIRDVSGAAMGAVAPSSASKISILNSSTAVSPLEDVRVNSTSYVLSASASVGSVKDGLALNNITSLYPSG